MPNRIDPDDLPWQSPAPGMREKSVALADGRRLRLVEFSDDFAEADWCRARHTGFVLKGTVTIEFAQSGKAVEFSEGDILLTQDGDRDRHKASVAPGHKALLLLIDGPD